MPPGLFRYCLLFCLLGLTGCSWLRKPEPPTPVKNPSDALVFENVTLEQSNQDGAALWKLRATQASYSQSRQQAKVKKPRGKFFQGQQELYEVEAAEGEVNQDGKTVLLRKDVVIQDLRDGAKVWADEAEWRPQEEVLILRGNLRGTQADLQVSAQEGTWQDSRNEVLLKGAPVTLQVGAQQLKVETEQVTWQIAQQRVLGDRPLSFQQFDAKQPERVIRTAQSQQGELDLDTQTIVLRQQAKLNFVQPPLDIASDLLRWQTQSDQVSSEARVTVTDREEQVTVVGDRANADLKTEIVEFRGNVLARADQRRSRLSADRLKWFSANQDVEAEGNVNYVQEQPPMEVSGPTAVGNLNEEKVLMSGGSVKTVVIPLE